MSLKTLLLELGFTNEQLAPLEDEKTAAEVNIKELAATGRNNIFSIVRDSAEGKEFINKKIGEGKIEATNKAKKVLNEKHGLGLTSDQMKDLSIEDVNDMALKAIDDKIKKASKGTDETLKDELNKIKNDLVAANEKYAADTSSLQDMLKKEKENSEREITMFHFKNAGKDALAKIAFAETRSDPRKILEETILRQVMENQDWVFHKDGRITQSDGVTGVNKPDNSGKWNHVSEVVAHLAAPFAPQSTGSGGAGFVDGKPVVLDPEAEGFL